MNNKSYFQDGADFYNKETGELIYTSSIHVKDLDVIAAEKALEEFLLFFHQETIDDIKKRIPDADISVLNNAEGDIIFVVKSAEIERVTKRMTAFDFEKLTLDMFNKTGK